VNSTIRKRIRDERLSRWQGWKGLFCGDGGWLAAAKAINAIGTFLKSQGVKFGFGRYGIEHL
jgi:hypothetical protein